MNYSFRWYLGMKSSHDKNDNCIITVLDANDLPPLNSNTSATVTSGITPIDSTFFPVSTANRNRRHENPHHRNILHRFLIFHRSDQSQP